jgi:hypothetical protein
MNMNKIRWTIVAMLLVVFAAAGTLTVRAGTFNLGPLVQVSGDSPFADCTADNVAAQTGTNFLNSEVEPWVVVNPNDPDNIVGSWHQDRWSDGGARGLGLATSFDGGASWQTGFLPGLTLCSGGEFERASDPWLSFAPNGDLYFLSLTASLNPSSQLKHNAILVTKSTDGGQSWEPQTTLVRDISVGIFDDKETITADPTDSNFVYAVWTRFIGCCVSRAELARTTDGGETWEAPREMYRSPDDDSHNGHQIVVLPDGTLVDIFSEFKIRGISLLDISAKFIRSDDKGLTWSSASNIQQLLSIGVSDPETDLPLRTSGFLTEVAVDPTSGNLYVVWEDARFSNFEYNSIAFSQSEDGGITWSDPVKVNQTPANIAPGNQQAFVPSIHVAADGTVAVTYYDFRNNTDDPETLLTDHFAIHCHVDCADSANWMDEIRLTDASFDTSLAPVSRGYFLGDYVGLDFSDGDFVSFFAQSHGGDPASIFFRRFGP